MPLVAIGSAGVALLAVGIIAIGARFLLRPAAAARAFGVPAPADGPGGAYFAVKGVRDIASGLICLAVLLLADPATLAWVVLTAAVIPVADAAIVLRWGGPKGLAYGVHGGTALAMVAIAALLLLG